MSTRRSRTHSSSCPHSSPRDGSSRESEDGNGYWTIRSRDHFAEQSLHWCQDESPECAFQTSSALQPPHRRSSAKNLVTSHLIGDTRPTFPGSAGSADTPDPDTHLKPFRFAASKSHLRHGK